MIELTRLNGTLFVLNAELIEQIESAPDTVITLTTGNNIIVREPRTSVVQKIIEYRQSVLKSSSSNALIEDPVSSGTQSHWIPDRDIRE